MLARLLVYFFFSSRRRHTRYIGDWSSDVCSSDLADRIASAAKQVVAALSAAGADTAVVCSAQRLTSDAPIDTKIGRASCREREEISGSGESLKKRDKTPTTAQTDSKSGEYEHQSK